VTSYSPGEHWLVSDLLKYGVKIEAKPEEEPRSDEYLVSWFPMLLLIGVWIFFMRRCRAAAAAAPSRSASRAPACWTNRPTPSASLMCRLRRSQEEWRSWSTSCATRPSSELGGRIPRGVLMVGPLAP